MRGSFDTPIDHRIAELAERQHGVVAHRQLVALGLRPGAIEHRITAGRLHPVHVGVYAVGHRRLSAAGRRMAAVLACGDGAVLSHQTAADVWGIRRSASPQIHVTVPTTNGRARPGIRIHRTRLLRPQDRAAWDALPVTSVARTLQDLAPSLAPDALRKAVEAAVRLRLFDRTAVLDAVPGRPARALARAVEEADPAPVRSVLESDVLALCREHGLPRPLVNTVVAGLEVDFCWPASHLVVEADGWEHHRTRRAFEEDRRRDVRLRLAGFTVVRFTHDAIVHDGPTVGATLRALL